MTKSRERLTPKSETIKKLLLRSGNECAFPNCSEVIFNDQDILVAECCHIEATEPGGERYNQKQTPEVRRSIKNLLFLCHKHHTETNDVIKYDVESLQKIKTEHEKRFSEKPINVNPNLIKQVIDSFEEIRLNIEKTLNTVKEIKANQDFIIDQLSPQIKNIEPEVVKYSEIFDAPPVYQFKGRKAEIIELKSVFLKYNTFIIAGLSGIGKSNLVAQFLSEIKSHKILWIDCEIVRTKEIFLNHVSKFIKQEFSDKSIEHILSVSDDSVIQNTLLTALNRHCTCLIFDGLNSKEHALYSLLRPLNENLSVSKIFISTTHNLDTTYWRNPVHKLLLKGLEKNIFIELLDSYKIPNVTLEQGDRLYQLLDGHPYLLKLSASILEYQPVEYFINKLEIKGSDEINEYVKQIVIDSLGSDEIDLLTQLALFENPFRYSIGDFISPQNFPKTFKGLQEKFLVDKASGYFYNIPEFIKTHVISEVKDDIYILFVNYLLSITSGICVFEKIALIHYALKVDMIDVAKKETSGFLSYLMEIGNFKLAYQYSHELENDLKSEKWSFIYFIQGRILRFQQDFEKALEKYNKGLKLSIDTQELYKFKFETASIITLLSRKSNDTKLLEKAILIYEELAQVNNASISLQSQLSLSMILMPTEKYFDAIQKIEALSKTINPSEIEVNVLASMWQVLGDAYSKNKDYNKAYNVFNKSIDLYNIAKNKFGMNVIDGLFHLYSSYGWALAEARNYPKAVEMFGQCVDLCSTYDLGLNQESALFDYGFHLAMDQQFEMATKVLSDHYSFIVDNNLISVSDMPFIYGTLSFVHWYNGSFIDAIELLGLYILSCYSKNINPAISIIEEDSTADKIDTLYYFKLRMYILFIPSGKTFKDLNNWLNIVCSHKPELTTPLGQFHYFEKK